MLSGLAVFETWESEISLDFREKPRFYVPGTTPPSTDNTVPVTNEALSEASQQ